MTNEERAARYVILFNAYGDKWRDNVPVDAIVKGETVWVGPCKLVRGADDHWSNADEESP